MSDFDSFFEDLKIPLHGVRLPEFSIESRLKKKYDLPDSATNYDFLIQVCRTNFKKLKIPQEERSKYTTRIKYELDAVKDLGFLDYILLVWTVINFCEENSIPVGPGRGSAAGSLILYLLRVTRVDPIKYDLFFERFISKIRAKKQIVDGITYLDGSLMCDVDIDICYYNRQRVIKFLDESFLGKTSKILTLTTLSGKILIKECGKIIDEKPETEMNEITSLIPKAFGQIKDLKETYVEVADFQRWCDKNPRSYQTALKLRGLIKNKSVHPSGMMLSYLPIEQGCPTELTTDKEQVSSYDMNWVSISNVKLDLLGLRSVSIVHRVCSLVGIKVEDIDFTDPMIYQQLQDLKTPHGIFQIEADTNFKVCKKVKPKNLDELSGVLALARPGALEFVDQYANFTTTGTLDSVHPFFDDIVGNTGGVCLAKGTKIVNADTGFEFSIEDEKACLGSPVFALDEKNKLTKSKITNWYHNGKREVFEISFNYKLSSIKATDNHKFLTLNGWKELKDLKVGDYLAEPKHLHSSGRKSFSKHKLRVLGYLLSEGSLTNGSHVGFVSKDRLLLEKYKQSVELGFPNTITREITQIRDVTRVTSKKRKGEYHEPSDLLIWLRELNLKTNNGGCHSREKFIPDFIFGLDKESISVFLAALFDGDGMSLKATFNYKTISRQLASDLQKLLLRISFSSKVYGNSTAGYNISIENPLAFFEQVGKYFERESLKRFKNDFGATNRLFPLDYLLKQIKKNSISIVKRKLAREAGVSRSNLKFKQKFVSESTFRTIAEYYSLTTALNSLDTNWSVIKSIVAAGVEDVYDVTVEDSHNFVANSIFTHNCLYQETLMQMAHKIGFTLDEAEVLRRIVGKKKVEEVKVWKEKIAEKIKENKLNPEIGDVLWRILENSANYSFNKSHSVSYAALAACTIYLKFKYPKQFFLALLEMTRHEPAPLIEVSKIQKELRHFGITLLGPHILKSDTDFSIQGNNIRFGLSSIKGISEKTMEKLKNFKTENSDKFEVFEAAKQAGISIGVLSALIQAGALDGFSDSRSRVVLEAQLWNLLTVKEKILSKQYASECELDLLRTVKKLSVTKNENEKLLIKASRLDTIRRNYDPYLKIYQQNNKSESFANWYYENQLLGYTYNKSLKDIFISKIPNLQSLMEVGDLREGSIVYIIGRVQEASEWVSRNAKKTRTFKMIVSDEFGTIPVLSFNNKIDENKDLNNGTLPQEGDIVIVKGTKKADCLFAETIATQTLKIYTKLSDLKEKNVDNDPV